jgi:hypothetical protein
MINFPLRVRVPRNVIEEIYSINQLNRLILELLEESNRFAPDFVVIEDIHGYNLKLGLADETFIQLCKPPDDSSIITTRGNPNRMGTKAFFQNQRSPLTIEIGCLISFSMAKRAVMKFIEDCELTEEINWDIT